MADSQLFTTAGYYSGNIVAVKMINKPYIYLTKQIIQELNEVSKSIKTLANILISQSSLTKPAFYKWFQCA